MGEMRWDGVEHYRGPRMATGRGIRLSASNPYTSVRLRVHGFRVAKEVLPELCRVYQFELVRETTTLAQGQVQGQGNGTDRRTTPKWREKGASKK